METEVPAAGPWTVLALAVLGLLVVGLATLARRTPAPRFRHDDLPTFRASPPATVTRRDRPAAPVSLAAPSAVAPLALPPPVGRTAPVPRHPRESRLLTALAAGALLVVALAAGVSLLTRAPGPASPARPSSSPAAPAPALPLPAPSPAPGEAGAGGLAFTSLPLGRDGEAVRLAFEGMVLERYAVGVRAAYPSASITVRGPHALVHLQLAAANCFADAAPPDPVAAGCAASPTEYADLPTPALTVAWSGPRLTVSGRFATYVRRDGTAPVYTGRVYDVTITVVTGHPDRHGGAAASGAVSLGTGSARSAGGPALNAARFGS